MAFVIELDPPGIEELGADSAVVPPIEAPARPEAPPSAPGETIPADWRTVLDFERGWSGSVSAKQRAIRERFHISSPRYHQLLDRALELPEALAYDPALVARLRRVREARRRKRSARRVDAEG